VSVTVLSRDANSAGQAAEEVFPVSPDVSLHPDLCLENRRSVYLWSGKRFMDFFLSFAGLILLAPLLVVIGGLIKISSKGRILFRQQRVGRDGKLFWIVKFRSMGEGADRVGNGITPENDLRVTRLGIFLRKWKLDELPQLWNVLRGEMSLVGPRPELPFYANGYTAEQRCVLTVKPGITDPASLRYRDEGLVLRQSADPERLYRERILPEKLSLNLQYLKDITFAHDLALILSTVRSVLRRSEIPQKD
jgi:lipopolysaccharide/colanic/teichoic acid biosynthesis glycosyltransferase